MPSRWRWVCAYCNEEFTAPDQFKLWHMAQTHRRKEHPHVTTEHVLKMDREEQAGHA